MTITRFDQNKLLVEGKEEVFLISELAEKRLGIEWGNHVRKEPPVNIHDCGGVENLLDSASLSTHLKTPNLKALGVVVDANSDLSSRWQQLRNRFLSAVPAIPADPDPAGTIVEHESGLRLGFWIMPDNRSPGMIEDLLQRLVAGGEHAILKYAGEAVAEAQQRGAKLKSAHTAKAIIHTFLAWNDPPGLQLHQAVTSAALDAKSPNAQLFFDWFVRLFPDAVVPSPTTSVSP
jgi:hypothetical protein